MQLTSPQLRLLKEGKWSKCPGCGSKEAYQGFKGDWECPEDECKFFSKRRQTEVKGEQPKKPLDRYDTFKACDHDLGYFQFDYTCGECGAYRSAVSNDWDDADNPFLYATINGKHVTGPYDDERLQAIKKHVP